MFSAAADACDKGQSGVHALRAGVKKMTEDGGAEIGHRTMVDVLVPTILCADLPIPLGDLTAAPSPSPWYLRSACH